MANMQAKSTLTRAREYLQTPKGRQLSMWMAFFVFWCGAAAYLPYISVYYESVNLKGGQIGQLNSIPYFVSFFSSIIFAFLSDVTRRHKLVLTLCVLGITGVLFIYPSARTFAAFVPIVLAYALMHAPIGPILDETALASLERPELYGKLRVGGSIGWGIMVLVTGYLIDHLGLGLPIIFYIYIFFNFIFLINIGIMPSIRRHSSAPAKPVSPIRIWEMLKQPGFMLFMLVIIVWGVGESSIGNFLFLHIKGLGGSSTLMGIALSVSLIGEIITFTFAHKIQAQLGPHKMILAAFVVLFTWLTGLSLIRDPNAIPFFQIFGGAGFALLQSGSVAYVDQRAPREIGTTAQAVRGALYFGLGAGVGAIISGMLYETSGSVILFRMMSFVSLAGFLLGVVAYLIERRRNSVKPA
jgi:PPP family 3-phenylpropionic acid transporter